MALFKVTIIFNATSTMPRTGSQGGHGHGHGSAIPGAQSGANEHRMSIPPFQPILFQMSHNDSGITTEHQIAANNMIYTEGPTIDTLQQHQSCCRSTQLLLQDQLRPYAIPSSRTSSHRTSSRVSMSTMSLDNLDDNSTNSQHARHGSRHGALKLSKIGFYSENNKQNIYHARKLIVLNMILESGWEDDCNTLDAIARECLSSACVRTSHITKPTTAIIKLLVQEAEGCLPALGLQPDGTLSPEDDMACIIACVNAILDEKNLQDYFLHGWDTEHSKILVFSAVVYFKFHEGFWFGRNSPFLNDPAARVQISKPSWFMYELLGAALYCAICHAATGRLSKTKNVLQFSAHEFQPVAAGIRNAIKQYMDCPDLDDGEFLPQMTAHHVQCLKALRSCTGEGLPTKQYNINVPSSSLELYQPRMDNFAATLLTSSLTLLPSLTYPQNTAASSSSSSSNTSWYPHDVVQSPQVVSYAPYVPDDHDYIGHGKMPSYPQPQYYIQPESQPQAFREPEVVLDQSNGPPFMQDDPCSSSSSLAGWGVTSQAAGGPHTYHEVPHYFSHHLDHQ
ncbi:uncharacterized protein BJ212DRAFT_1295111 [Suillus subaureus]|uniref:Uncharacterized protein n=1 Tax=Suillus subaureus TaxID=48587 RepID=A0A9P7ELS7_9AGAM|nr:uncharacterized protein BJ212DRAFT_1295111 [Suillus subaureus]KAG1825740.1 hypothetical protein BJ212DRAFT_1295111 [Suillus subaureus]